MAVPVHGPEFADRVSFPVMPSHKRCPTFDPGLDDISSDRLRVHVVKVLALSVIFQCSRGLSISLTTA